MRTDVYDGPLSGHRRVLAIVAAGKSVEEKPPEKLVNLNELHVLVETEPRENAAHASR